MIRESQFSNAVQRYGKKRTYAIFNQNKLLASRFLYKMCQFVYETHIPIEDVLLLFEHIYALGLKIDNINSLSYQELKSLVDGETYKESSFWHDAIYTSPSKLVEVYLLHSFEEAKSLPISTKWCICNNEDQWNMLTKNGNTFYLIVNRNFSKRSMCRYVIARVYSNGNIEYIDMSNNAIISGGGNKPSYETFTNSLEGASNHLKPMKINISENKTTNNMKQNKQTIRLNESQLRQMIKESIK